MFILRNVYTRDFVQASFLIYNVLFDSLALNVRLAPLKLQMTDRILQTLESEKNRTSAQKTGKGFQVHIPKVQQPFTASSPKQKNWLCSQGRRDWICTFPCQSKWQQEIVRDCDLMYSTCLIICLISLLLTWKITHCSWRWPFMHSLQDHQWFTLDETTHKP